MRAIGTNSFRIIFEQAEKGAAVAGSTNAFVNYQQMAQKQKEHKLTVTGSANALVNYQQMAPKTKGLHKLLLAQ